MIKITRRRLLGGVATVALFGAAPRTANAVMGGFVPKPPPPQANLAANAVDYIPYYVESSTNVILGDIIKGPAH